MKDEMMDLINEKDEVIGVASIKEIRKKNLLHRGAHAFVFNSKGELFVHKRTMDKNIYPGYYDMLAGGGVQSKESYEDAIKREVKEELGIKGIDFVFLFKYKHHSDKNNCIGAVYSCIYDGEITLQKEEIDSGEFMSINELQEMMGKATFCEDSIEIFQKYLRQNEK